MTELLCHLVGDYVLQNHAMASLKTKSSFWAAIHALLYTLPFCGPELRGDKWCFSDTDGFASCHLLLR